VKIAEYLDRQYPDTPKLFPEGSHALQHAFLDWFLSLAHFSIIGRYGIPPSNAILTPRGEKYFRAKREKQFGMKMEEMMPRGEEHVVTWGKLRGIFEKIDEWLQKASADGPYLGGPQPGFSDFVVAAVLLWFKILWGDGDELDLWEDVKTWSGGRWVKFLDGFERYQTVI
jgi:glutathione S-transferase